MLGLGSVWVGVGRQFAREKKRCAQGAYHAETAQNEADGKALPPRLCELVVDGELV